MSIPKQQHKLKPQLVAKKKAYELAQKEALEQYRKPMSREKQQNTPTPEDLSNRLSDRPLTIEAKLAEQLETCVSTLLGLISLGTAESEPQGITPAGPAVLNSYSKRRALHSSVAYVEKPKPLLNFLKTFTFK